MQCGVMDLSWRIREWWRCLVLQYDVQSVDDSGDVTQDCEQDVDQEVGTAASLEDDTYGRQNDGNNDLGDIAGCERHGE